MACKEDTKYEHSILVGKLNGKILLLILWKKNVELSLNKMFSLRVGISLCTDVRRVLPTAGCCVDSEKALGSILQGIPHSDSLSLSTHG
jgi:hypothetical protein